MENEIRVGRAPARHVDDGESLLVVDDLKTHFAVAAGSVRAVDGWARSSGVSAAIAASKHTWSPFR